MGWEVSNLSVQRLGGDQRVFLVFLQAPFTGGEDGLQGVPRGNLFGLIPLANDTVLYYVVLAFVLSTAMAELGRFVKNPGARLRNVERCALVDTG